MLKVDVIVVGAGMIGASCALKLAQNSNLSIALIDSSAAVSAVNKKQENIRVSALAEVSVKLLRELNVWGELQEKFRFPYQKMRVWDEMNDAELEFDAAEIGSRQLGFIVDNQSVVHVLQQAIDKQDNIKTLYSVSTETLIQDEQGVNLYLASGEQIQAELLIAADGANSWVRQAVGIQVREFEYKQQAIVAKIKTRTSHQSTAWQRFLSSGPVAVLPLLDEKGDNNQASIVWSTQTSEADRLMAFTDKKFAKQLQYALEDRFGEIQLLSKRLSFPLRSNIASRYVDGAVILIGDAAHRIHPMAGQGANLGFKDVKTLTEEILAAYNRKKSIASYSLLRRYERIRRLDNQLTDKTMTMLYRLFGSENIGLTMLRGIGLKVLNRFNIIKDGLVKQAMGVE